MMRFFRRSAVPYIAAGLSVLFLCVFRSSTLKKPSRRNCLIVS